MEAEELEEMGNADKKGRGEGFLWPRPSQLTILRSTVSPKPGTPGLVLALPHGSNQYLLYLSLV